ncbi:Aldehyde/histidinol dehydrogenase [Dactylonectria macrodidyma]|uniref:Aldehyde/histidinol dehydrogenase n=1 Tax=Dactylonectria macrodidyma TaxID=307937 RepID=A0A9P9DKY5_9HYPO|nr:Aldehyde/histidinol dehydrogenase [Dactylonectria macrodidyma]
MAEEYARLRAAAVDGRAHNVYFRQTQVERLCKAVVSNARELSKALKQDFEYRRDDVAIELYATVAAIKESYAALEPEHVHDEEYLIAHGKDMPSFRKPAGIVYIEPCASHSLLNSALAPLTAAVAAGNCVILLVSQLVFSSRTLALSTEANRPFHIQLEENAYMTATLLRRILPAALDNNTFALASSPIKDPDLLAQALVVKQSGEYHSPSSMQLSSFPQGRTVAIVDRTADVKAAARHLAGARFGLGGRSPYAPDCVFVNEFVKKAFLQALVGECISLSECVVAETSGRKQKAGKHGSPSRVRSKLEALNRNNLRLHVVTQELEFAVVDILDRDLKAIGTKTCDPVLIIHAVRSLDDAIGLVDLLGSPPCLAAYHFASLHAGKYLSHAVDAQVTFVNTIPKTLLVGPAFPASRDFDRTLRYPSHFFTVGRPAYVSSLPSDRLADAVLLSRSETAVQQLLAAASSPLQVQKRWQGGRIGFFEQASLIYVAVLITAFAVSGAGLFLYIKSHWLGSVTA